MQTIVIKNKETGETIPYKRRVVIDETQVGEIDFPKNWVQAHCKNPKCTKVIFGNKSTIKFVQYCSRKCLAQNTIDKGTVEKICTVCGKPFLVNKFREQTSKYCGNKCKKIGQYINRHKEVTCINCNIKFATSPSRNPKFCSKTCRYEYEKHHNVLSFSNARGRLKQVGRFVKCEKCGYNEHLEILGIHHIDRNHNNNALDNLIVLCPNCHSLEHKKHIPQGGSK